MELSRLQLEKEEMWKLKKIIKQRIANNKGSSSNFHLLLHQRNLQIQKKNSSKFLLKFSREWKEISTYLCKILNVFTGGNHRPCEGLFWVQSSEWLVVIFVLPRLFSPSKLFVGEGIIFFIWISDLRFDCSFPHARKRA